MWSKTASAKRDKRVVAAEPYAIVETDNADSEQYKRYKALATMPPGGGRFIARGGKLAVLEGDAAEATGRLESEDWGVPVHRHVPGVPAFRQRVKTWTAPGRTIMVDRDPPEIRVESAALIPICALADAVPSNVPSTSTRQ